MLLKTFRVAAILLTALSFAPVGAHLLEMRGKMLFAKADYATVQTIYRGWSFTGVVLIAAILADLGLVILSRRYHRAFLLALAGLILMAATLAVFFIWTFPVNQSTDNWTVLPDNWKALRARWEYSHAANAVIAFAALCFVIFSSLDNGE